MVSDSEVSIVKCTIWTYVTLCYIENLCYFGFFWHFRQIFWLIYQFFSFNYTKIYQKIIGNNIEYHFIKILTVNEGKLKKYKQFWHFFSKKCQKRPKKAKFGFVTKLQKFCWEKVTLADGLIF